MSPRERPGEPAPEFRPYRQALGGTLAALTIGAILYLLASIAATVFARREVRPRRAPIRAENMDQLLECQGEVERLFQEINERTFDLQAMVGIKEVDLAQQWDAFSRRWHSDWQEVGQHCRFVELRDRGLGTGFDRLAYAHEGLEEIELKFAALLRNYIDSQVPHIDAIRRGLEASRHGLETQKQKLGSAPHPSGEPVPK